MRPGPARATGDRGRAPEPGHAPGRSRTAPGRPEPPEPPGTPAAPERARTGRPRREPAGRHRPEVPPRGPGRESAGKPTGGVPHGNTREPGEGSRNSNPGTPRRHGTSTRPGPSGPRAPGADHRAPAPGHYDAGAPGTTTPGCRGHRARAGRPAGSRRTAGRPGRPGAPGAAGRAGRRRPGPVRFAGPDGRRTAPARGAGQPPPVGTAGQPAPPYDRRRTTAPCADGRARWLTRPAGRSPPRPPRRRPPPGR